MSVYTFHEDPGHGWLEVPVEELHRLEIYKKITPYSYLSMDGKVAFLEEDCDAGTFLNAAKKANWVVEIKDLYHNRFPQNLRQINA